MTENEIRVAFAEATKDKESLRGFWHTRIGREIRKSLNEISFANFETVQEKVWSLTNNSSVRPLCVVCKSKSASFYQYGFLETCGNLSCSNKLAASRISEETKRELQRRRVLAAASPEAIEKKKQSLAKTMERRGDEIREMRKRTCLERYGVEHPLQVEEIRNQIKETNLERYGVTSVLKCPEYRKRHTLKQYEKYARDVLPGKLEAYSEKGYIAMFDTWLGADHQYQWKHKCGHMFKQSLSNGVEPDCPVCRPKSKPEQFVIDHIKSRGIDIKHNDRKLLRPYEIDILIESHDLAIEINGAYWHREGSQTRPLLEKTEHTESLGYQLLHFWDFEISEKPEIVKSIIDSKLGVITNKIGASRCKIVNVDTQNAKKFIDANHLSGYTPAKFKFGLSYKGELVAIATFSKARFSKEDAYELVRFCVKKNYHVHGALSKLVTYAAKTLNSDIISFADRRISNGRGYIAAGFNVVGITAPNYWYYKDGVRIPRYAAMKHKLPKLLGSKFNARLTEQENMDAAGYLIIKDSGNIKLKFCLNK